MQRVKWKIKSIVGISLFCWLIVIGCNKTRPDEDIYDDDVENPEDEDPEDEEPNDDEGKEADFSDSDFQQEDISYTAQANLETSEYKRANATFEGEFKFKWEEPFDSDFI